MTDDHSFRREDFSAWLREMGVSAAKASRLLGKSYRRVKAYKAGEVVPPLSVRLLMSALAAGYRPRPWPDQSSLRA